MNIFEQRVNEFNKKNLQAQKELPILTVGTKSPNQQELNDRYEAYKVFAEKNISATGTYSHNWRSDNESNNDVEDEKITYDTKIYTEYGPVIKIAKEETSGKVQKTGIYEGFFKFNVGNTQKLLYAHIKTKTIDFEEQFDSAIIRREDGVFENQDWSMKSIKTDNKKPDQSYSLEFDSVRPDKNVDKLNNYVHDCILLMKSNENNQ